MQECVISAKRLNPCREIHFASKTFIIILDKYVYSFSSGMILQPRGINIVIRECSRKKEEKEKTIYLDIRYLQQQSPN